MYGRFNGGADWPGYGARRAAGERSTAKLGEALRTNEVTSWQLTQRRDGFDAMFQVGFHARAGTPNGFISHTMVPGLSLSTDGFPLTEWGAVES